MVEGFVELYIKGEYKVKEVSQHSFKLKDFFEKNSKEFEEKLLSEAVNVKDKIDEILAIGNIDLIKNAHKLVVYIIEGKEKELQLFAKQEGIAWATHSLTLSFKLEWVQAIRRTLWNFIEQYNELADKQAALNFFRLEKEVNNRVDTFLNTFFINYSTGFPDQRSERVGRKSIGSHHSNQCFSLYFAFDRFG